MYVYNTVGGPTNLLPDTPHDLVSSYNKSIPIIVGATKDDGAYVATGKFYYCLTPNFRF